MHAIRLEGPVNMFQWPITINLQPNAESLLHVHQTAKQYCKQRDKDNRKFIR